MKSIRRMVTSIVFETTLISTSCLCSAATLVVDPSGIGDYTDIQAAIDAAQDGDTVLFKPGEYEVTAPIVPDDNYFSRGATTILPVVGDPPAPPLQGGSGTDNVF